MIELFNKSLAISLGWTCRPALLIQFMSGKAKVSCERQVFDWLGSPMWAINRLIENNFEDFIKKEEIVRKKRFKNGENQVYIHKLYNIRFLHDFVSGVTENTFKFFKDKYERRIERFQNLLNSDKELFFIRLEYDDSLILEHDDIVQEKGDEKYHLEKFTDILMAKGTKYTVLFLTYSCPQSFDAERRIIYVNFTRNSPVDERQMYKIVNDNKDFIYSSMIIQPP